MNSQDFLNYFPQNAEWLEPTPFDDGSIGFSIQIEYPKSLQEKFIIPDNLKFVALFHVYIDEKRSEVGSNKKLIGVNVHFTLKDGKRLQIDESNASNIYRPVDLVSYDDYFFDSVSEKFFYKDTQIESSKIINDLFQLHIKKIGFKGLFIRGRFLFWFLLGKLCKGISLVLSRIFLLIYGEKISYGYLSSFLPQSMKETLYGSQKKDPGPFMTFFGYNAPTKLVVSYCVIHLFAYLLIRFLNIAPSILIAISKNSFLTIIYVIVSLAILEVPIKKFLRFSVSKLEKYQFRFSNKAIKI